MRLTKVAVTIIHNDIKFLVSARDSYPDADSIENHADILPATLSEILMQVTNKSEGNYKVSAVG